MAANGPGRLDDPSDGTNAGTEVLGDPAQERVRDRIFPPSVEHLYGPEEVSYGIDELIVLCLVRDGRPYVRPFIEHYRSLGVRHVVLLDNGSVDGTVDAAREYDVTVLQTDLPFKTHKLAARRYLIDRFARGRWCLYADIDELFDYPYSDVVGLDSFLGYLRRKSYTAVVAQMLDMFSDRPLRDASASGELAPSEHRFYDISNVREMDYGRALGRYGNVAPNEDIKVFRDGIQETVFGVPMMLTKHPLMFIDGEIEPMRDSSHLVGNARLADVTCVLFHYKFLEHFREKAVRAVHERNYHDGSAKYESYLAVLEKEPDLLMRRDTSKELRGVDQLVDEGFLTVSADYMCLVDLEEGSSGEGTVRERPRRIAAAFSKARVRAEEETAKARKLRRNLKDLENRLARERREIARLQRTQQRLVAQLQAALSSTGWRLLTVLGRVRAWLPRR